jgi:hypothetical protein
MSKLAWYLFFISGALMLVSGALAWVRVLTWDIGLIAMIVFGLITVFSNQLAEWILRKR